MTCVYLVRATLLISLLPIAYLAPFSSQQAGYPGLALFPRQGTASYGSKPSAQETPALGPATPTELVRLDTISTRVMAGANATYGYEVLVNGRVRVRQPSIPGRAGLDGFRTPQEARRVAALVAAKVRRHQFPPAVTAAELDSLGIRP